jgi:hypothetical protein
MCRKYADSSGGGTELDIPSMVQGFSALTTGCWAKL